MAQQSVSLQPLVSSLIVNVLNNSSQNTIQTNSLSQDKQTYFCYMYVTSSQQAWTCIAYLFVAFYLLYKSVQQYKITKMVVRLNQYIKYTYYSIFASLILYIVKITFSEIIFWVQLATFDTHTQQVYRLYSFLSKFLVVIDVSQVFWIITAILFVPANWINNFIQFTKKQTIIWRQSRSNPKMIEKNTKLEKVYKKILETYFVVRCIFTYIPFIPLFIINDQEFLQGLTLFMLIFIEVQFLVLLIFITVAVFSIRNNAIIKDLLNEKDIKLMQKNYMVLLLCTLLRLVTDILFTLYGKNDAFEQQTCFIKQTGTLNVYDNIIIIQLQAIFTQFFSIVSILKIYRISDAQVQKYTSTISLLGRQRQKSISEYRAQIGDNKILSHQWKQ